MDIKNKNKDNDIPLREDLIKSYDFETDHFNFLPITIQESVDYNTSEYVLRLHGILENRKKIRVDIYGIKVFFDILIDDRVVDEDVLKMAYEPCEIIYKYPIMGYNDEKKKFLRVYTKNHHERLKELKLIKDVYKTYSDDLTSHYRKVARENKINLTQWNIVQSPLTYCDRNQIKFKKVIKIMLNDIGLSPQPPKNEKMMIFTWDIETYSDRGDGDIPQVEFDKDEVFMICVAIFWKDEKQPILQICLTTQELDGDDNWIVRESDSQHSLILDFAYCVNHLNPDVITGFNDTGYNWPFILGKAEKLDILKKFSRLMLDKDCDIDDIDTIKKHNIKTDIIKYDDECKNTRYKGEAKDNFNIPIKKVKINFDEYAESRYFHRPESIVIDTRIALKKLFPKSEKSSLNYYLEFLKLDKKLDLPHKTLAKYYHDAKNNVTPKIESKQNMYEIAKYCMVDAKRCQELLLKMIVVDWYRMTSFISYVSLSDSYYYANGIKVRNLLGTRANDRDTLITMIRNEESENGKYPGAYVFNPEKGLENCRPVTGLDFASLYPSLMMTYNLSPEKIILDEKEYKKYCDKYKLHKIKFMFNGREIKAWSVEHKNIQGNMGLYPDVLLDLLDRRNKMKKELNQLKKKIEDNALTNKHDDDDLLFRYNYVNLSQNALKVYMNSFYGEAGNPLSPFFLRPLAGAVTSAGQYNIKLVADFVHNLGFSIKYGDTDSLYLTCPKDIYDECDTEYLKKIKYFDLINDGPNKKKYLDFLKEEYWIEMVNLTMCMMNKLRDDVNEYLYKDNNTRYLKMAYEEVLFPVVFTLKKKYYGIDHVNIPNFHPKKLFIKGIDTVKRGQSEFFRVLCNEIMWKAVDIKNDKNMRDIVENVIRKYLEKKNDNINMFVLSATYRPLKQNRSVNNFIEQVNKKSIIIEPGERFEYVVIKHPNKNAKKYEKTVLLDNFDSSKMKLDMVYY